MKKILSILIVLVTVFIIQGCTRPQEQESPTDNLTERITEQTGTETQTTDTDAPQGSGDQRFNVMTHEHGYLGVQWLQHMNDYLPRRLAFSDRELETAEWIVSTLIGMGFDEDQVDIQTFSMDAETSSWWGEAKWMIEWFESMGYYEGLELLEYSQNIILTLPGQSEQTIIIGAHYDGMNNPGVSDNASGTVLLLENAYRMQQIDHYYTLQYVFFGAEEVGLIGSFYFADNMTQEEIDNLVMVINADVIMDGPELVYAIGYIEALPLSPIDILWETPGISQNALTEQVDEIAIQLNEQYNTEFISKPHGITLASDHLAFVPFGIPVMVFYATHPVEYPEMFSGDVLHSERDHLEYIMENHPGRIERALSAFGRFLEEIVSSEFVQ